MTSAATVPDDAMRDLRAGQALAERHDDSFNGTLRAECLSVEWFRQRYKVRSS
jgi:hypothetical protein